VKPDLTVVIPTRDRAALLRDSLRSVLAQRDVGLEVIVVDDGSTDGTPALLTHQRDGRVVVVRHDAARGVAAARNAGVERARGEWIAFLDDDDLWAPDKCRAQLDALACGDAAAWSCTGTLVVDASRAIRGAFHAPAAEALHTHLLTYNIVPGGGSGVVARTSTVRAVGAFDPSLRVLADWDLWIRLAQVGPLVAVDEPLLAYTLHESNMCSGDDGVLAELDAVAAKHAATCAVAGVELDKERWLDWVGFNMRRARRGGAAARIYLGQGVRLRRPRLLARAGGALLWPGRVDRTGADDPGAVTLPWRVAGDAWLSSYRNG
jgi:glycosyltransferase involved in cell wall biosynthesis